MFTEEQRRRYGAGLIPNTLTRVGPYTVLRSCGDCGAIVDDVDAHDRWHAASDEAR